MSDQLNVGDVVARVKTRKVIAKATDMKDVPFKLIKIKGSTAIGEDGNNHFIDSLKHITLS